MSDPTRASDELLRVAIDQIRELAVPVPTCQCRRNPDAACQRAAEEGQCCDACRAGCVQISLPGWDNPHAEIKIEGCTCGEGPEFHHRLCALVSAGEAGRAHE